MCNTLCMEKIDARKHSSETQYEIRKQVIRLRKKGISNQDVAQGVGIRLKFPLKKDRFILKFKHVI